MRLTNNLSEYGLISKIFHWLSAAVLLIQIPLGFYLVDLDFSDKRLTIESIHVTLGLSILYLTILRLIYKILNPTPSLRNSIFVGQRTIAKLNHIFLYLSILVITISGALKKLFNGEMLDLFIFVFNDWIYIIMVSTNKYNLVWIYRWNDNITIF